LIGIRVLIRSGIVAAAIACALAIGHGEIGGGTEHRAAAPPNQPE